MRASDARFARSALHRRERDPAAASFFLFARQRLDERALVGELRDQRDTLRHFEVGEVEARCDRTANERKVLARRVSFAWYEPRRLEHVRSHDDLRALISSEIRTEHELVARSLAE